MCSADRIDAFLDRVCSHIRWRPYCGRVRRELTDHILTCAFYLRAEQHFSEEQAVAQAIRLLGNPDELGSALNHAHRPLRRLFVLFGFCVLWAGIVYFGILILLALSK